MSSWLEADDNLCLAMSGSQLQQPSFGRGKTLSSIAEWERLGAELAATRVDGAEVMLLAADVAAGHQHVVADKGNLVVFSKFSMRLQFLPGIGSEVFADLLDFPNEFLALENICRNDLIFLG